MTTKNNGGPAFPRPTGGYGHGNSAQQGMTLRDYFAAKAMQAFITRSDFDEHSFEAWANAAYRMADSMLEARDK